MSTATLKTTKYPAADLRSWDDCPQGCGPDDDCCSYNSEPHIVMWPENGRLMVAPECSQHRFLLPAAGVLAFAGVPVTSTDDEYNRMISIDKSYTHQAIKGLNDAGADVTLIEDTDA